MTRKLTPDATGMTDYYRDRVRQGGIYSNQFVQFWFNNQVGPMQYGNAEKTVRRWGPKAPVGEPVGKWLE